MFNQHAKVILLNILLNSPFPRRPCQIMYPVYCRSPPSHKKKKFCITFVFDFSLDECNIQEKWKTIIMQNFLFSGAGVNEVLYGLCENGDSTHERETFR